MLGSTDLQSIFARAVDIDDEAKRHAFVAASCGDDATLRRELEELVAAHCQSGAFMELPAVADLASAPLHAPIGEQPGDQIGPYKLLEQIGEGGMGLVFMAEQTQPLRRRVALKIIKPGLDTRGVIARFEAERQALALMDHPNIARVFDAGATALGRPYFVMELVNGIPITDYCNHRKLSLTERLKLFVDVCRAVQHAHLKGVIHRDLKPSNLLVTECDGQAVVKVIDFGIAKALGQEQLTEKTLFTGLAQLMGTPAYMSPEQAALSAVDVDTRSDVYSLGVLLYELLTGAPPFETGATQPADVYAVRRMIHELDPPRPSARLSTLQQDALETLAENRQVDPQLMRRQLRRDLDWIVMKALEKDRARRYQSTSALAEDVEAFLRNDPVAARPPAKSYLLAKFARRHRWSLLGAGLAAIILLGAACGGYWALGVYRHGQTLTAVADQAAKRLHYCNDVQAAWRRVLSGDHRDALALLEAHAPGRRGAGEASFEWQFIHQLATARPLRTYAGHEADVLDADVSPDRRWLASCDRAGKVIIWDLATARLRRSLNAGGGEATAVKFSPDGRWLASTGQDRLVHLWKPGAWEEDRQLAQHAATVCDIAWSPDSRFLASAGRDGVVHIWDVEHSRLLQTLEGHADAVRAVAWSPDGRWVATSNADANVLLWNAKTWEQAAQFDAAGSATLAIAFSPDSHRLAFGGYERGLSVADVANPAGIVHRLADEQIWSLAFASNNQIVAGLGSGRMQVFQLRNGSTADVEPEWTTASRGRGTLRAVIPVGDDFQFVVARAEDRTIELVRAADVQGFCARPMNSMAIGSAAGWLLSFDDDYETTPLTDVSSGDMVARLPLEAFKPCPPAYCRSAGLLAVAANDDAVHIFDSGDWRLRKKVNVPTPPNQMTFSPDGRFLVGGCYHRRVWIIDLPAGSVRELARPPHEFGVVVQFSPNGEFLALGERNLTLLRTPDFNRVASVDTATNLQFVQFYPRGDLLAVGHDDGSLSLWDVPGLRPAGTYRLHSKFVSTMAFSPDGRTAATIGHDGMRLWDAASGREFCHMPMEPASAHWVEFTDDGCLLAGNCNSPTYYCFGGLRSQDARFQWADPPPQR